MRKGIHGPTEKRLELAADARRLRETGMLVGEVGRELGISRSYASALLRDPDGVAERARKDSYGRACRRCGAMTSGSDGHDSAPELCQECARATQKYWTEERIIDAVRRWAAVHGRAPTANDWRVADPLDGYPSCGSVFGPDGAFTKWADAIEAAGFARPTTGRRAWKETGMPSVSRGGYVVMREKQDGSWDIVAERDDRTEVAALNAALNGTEPDGRWVAIPRIHFQPRELKPRTIYEFADEEH